MAFTGLFLVGFAIEAPMADPLLEIAGRNSVFIGLDVGPAIGGLIGQSEKFGWRWVDWSTLIISAVIILSVLLFQPETHAPTLLKRKSKIMAARIADELPTTGIIDDQKNSAAKASVLASFPKASTIHFS